MSQNKTIAYYDNSENEYAKKTVNANMSAVYSMFQRHLPSNASVLDAGCGSGRDSLYFLNAGYDVTAVDASKLMCESASELIHQTVIHKSFAELNYKNCFDGIWACASLLHIYEHDFPEIMNRIYAGLVNGGVLYASWKYGAHERIEKMTGRFFCDMDEERIQKMIEMLPGATILEEWLSNDIRPGVSSQKWINVIVKKAII